MMYKIHFGCIFVTICDIVIIIKTGNRIRGKFTLRFIATPKYLSTYQLQTPSHNKQL